MHCAYVESLHKLRDQLVCGCQDKRLQYKLLADPGLTYENAVQLARSDETAERGNKDLTGRGVRPTYKLNARQPRSSQPSRTLAQPPTQPCSRYRAAHSPMTGRFKSAICNYCKKQGHMHIVSVCRKKSRDQQQQKGRQAPPPSKTFQLQSRLER